MPVESGVFMKAAYSGVRVSVLLCVTVRIEAIKQSIKFSSKGVLNCWHFANPDFASDASLKLVSN